MDKYIVMLNNPSRKDDAPPLPLADDDVLLFESLDDAEDAADLNIVGEVCGYEVFKLGEGYS